MTDFNAPTQTYQRRPPNYTAISRGAGMLNLMGVILLFVGIGIIAVAGCSIYLDYQDSQKRGGFDVWKQLTVPFISSVVAATPELIGGVLLRMAGAIALAIRDMARNSFR